MPVKGSKRHNANQHHNHRPNGLAQPGKKIEKLSKPRSNGQLNGVVQPQPPAKPQRLPSRHGSLTSSEDAFAEVAQGRDQAVGLGEEPETLGDAERYHHGSEDTVESQTTHTAELPGQLPRRIDVNASGNPAVHVDNSSLRLAATILRACPLADTLAILIILLQIPAAFVTVVHFLFVGLTFVPPSGSSLFVLPSLGGLFQGSEGTPSLATIAITDIVFFVGWLFLWTPAQDLALELSQAVIAVSLGGRFGGRTRDSRDALMCIGIVILSSLGRCRCLRLLELSTILSVNSPHPVRTVPRMLTVRYPALQSQKSWLRTVLAIHVLAQRVVTIVRRWLSRQEEKNHPGTPGKIGHSDTTAASKGYIDHLALANVTMGGLGSPGSRGTGLQPPVPGPNLRDGKEKGSTGKRGKKQAVQVRNHQPLWAAVASTKTIVMKEYEQSHASAEAAVAEAKDINDLGNALFQSEEERVWVTRVEATEIFLESSFFFNSPGEPADDTDYTAVVQANGRAAIDRSKPFYVRVNQADWASTRIYRLNKEENGAERSTRGCWGIEIYGLAPQSNYICAFMRSRNDEMVYSLNLTTLQMPAGDTSHASVSTSPVPNATRPSSPLTTLKTSIAAAEAKLEEEKASIRKARKDHKVQTANLKKEVDASRTRFAHSGSNDDRQRQRLLQIAQHIRQAEDATAQVSSQTEAMGDVPEHDLSDCRESKENWENARRRHSDARTELNNLTLKTDRQMASMQAEAANIQQKRERVQARHSKLTDHFERVNNANIQGLSEKDRKTAAQMAKDDDRHAIEEQYIEKSQSLHESLKELQLSGQQLWQEVRAIENAYWEQQQRTVSAPTTPEGNLPGTTMPSRHPIPTRYNNYVFPHPAASGLPAQATMLSRSGSGYREGRARSSSLLSNLSGLTDFVDAPTVPPGDMIINSMGYPNREVPRSDGGFSGGRSRSGSHRDSSSPFPKPNSPFGPGGQGPSPVWR